MALSHYFETGPVKIIWRSILMLIIAFLAGLVFLLGTTAGLKSILLIADRLAGPQISLSADVKQGRILGNFVLHEVRVELPVMKLQLSKASLAWQPSSLFKGVIDIQQLKLADGQISIFASQTNDSAAGNGIDWLPDVTLRDLDVDTLKVMHDERVLMIERFSAAAELQSQQLVLTSAELQLPEFIASASGSVDLQTLSATDVQLEWNWQTAELLQPVAGSAALTGDVNKMQLAAELISPTKTLLNMELENLTAAPSWRAEFSIAQMNLQRDVLARLPDVEILLSGSSSGNSDNAELNASGNLFFGEVEHPWKLDANFPLTDKAAPTVNIVSGQARASMQPDKTQLNLAHVLLDIPDFADLWPGLTGQLTAELTTKGRLGDDELNADIKQLSFEHQQLGKWQIDTVSALSINGDIGKLSGLCLEQKDARLCTDLAWQGSQIDAQLEVKKLHLETIPLLSQHDVYQLNGQLNGQLKTSLDGVLVKQLEMDLSMTEGMLQHELKSGSSNVMTFQSVTLNGAEQDGQLQMELKLADNFDGSLRARLMLPVDLQTLLHPETPLQGQIDAKLQQLDSIGVFLQEITLPPGNLTAAILLAGSMQAPRLTGEAVLQVPLLEAGEPATVFRQTELVLQLDSAEITVSGQSELAGQVLNLKGQASVASIKDWHAGLTVKADDVPVSAIPAISLPEEMTLAGLLRLHLDLAFNSKLEVERLDGEFSLKNGMLTRIFFDGDTEELAIRDLRITAAKKKDMLSMTGRMQDAYDGKLTVDMTLPAQLKRLSETDLPLKGSLIADFPGLQAFAIFLDDITLPEGTFSANVDVKGTRAAPLLKGLAALQVPKLELTEPVISFDDTRLDIELVGNALNAKGSSHIGDRPLTLEGNATLQDFDDWKATIKLAGDSIKLEDVFGSSLQTSSKLTLAMAPGQVNLTGDVILEGSEIFIRDISSTVRPSSDVRFVDEEKTAVVPWRITTDLGLLLTGDNRLRVAGFNGLLGGNVRVRSETGKLASGEGSLTVLEGQYRAFGATVPIRQGRLEFIGGALDDPAIQIESRRRIEQREVGFDVTGTLQAPVVTLVSSPAMDQSEILSWLLYGRAAGVTDGASTALLAGSINQLLGSEEEESFVQQMLGRMGLTGMGVEADLTSGLKLSRQLSPRLFVKYQVDVWEQTNRLILRYLLSEHWALEGISGDEGGADILYERER
jgi:autotransporter translocation and assembly factor TamB